MSTSTSTSPKSTRVRRSKPKSAETTAIPTVATTAKTGDSIVDTLNAYGFEYTREQVDVTKINRKQSRLNQARIDAPINEDQVLLYAEGMESGDVFPPIVLYKAGSEYIVADGNHRVAASDLVTPSPTTIDAYVIVNASPAQITSYIYEANSKHGLPTSMTDRLRQAIYLVERGVPRAQAAARLKIPAGRLNNALDVYNADQRFAKLGVRKLEALSQTAKRILDSIRSDDVLKPAALLALEAGLTTADLSAFVKRVNEPRTEREALRVINDERAARTATIKATAGGRIPVPMQLTTLLRTTSLAMNLDPDRILGSIKEIGPEARTEYARAAADAGTRLIELSMVIRRAESE